MNELPGFGRGDFKHLIEELCPVCGDKVSGYHYGLQTCESCKGQSLHLCPYTVLTGYSSGVELRHLFY